MAENQQAVEPVVPVVAPVVETPKPVETPVEREYTEIEQRALDQGWKPKEEWEGNPEDHRSAREYIDRGELLGKIKSQSTEIREVKQMLTTLSEHNKNVFLAGKQSMLAELKKARVVALKDDEHEAAVEIEDQIRETEKIINITKAAPVAKPSTPEQSPLFEAWLEKNSWYAKDEGMRNWADGAAMALGKKSKLEGRSIGEKDVYDHLSAEARKMFPQKFQRVGAPTIDGEGRKITTNKSGNKGGDKFEQLMSEMPEEMARAARSLIKSNLITKEKYVEDFDAIGGR